MCLWCAASFIKGFSTSPQKMLNLNLSSKVRWFKHYVQVLRDHENIVKMVSNELSLGKTVLTAYNSGFSVWLVISKQVCKLFDSLLLEPDGLLTTSRNRRWSMWGSWTSKTRLDKGYATSASLSKGSGFQVLSHLIRNLATPEATMLEGPPGVAMRKEGMEWQ